MTLKEVYLLRCDICGVGMVLDKMDNVGGYIWDVLEWSGHEEDDGDETHVCKDCSEGGE